MKKLFLIIFFGIIVSSCNNSTTPENNQSKDFWPLKVGNQWVMEIINYDSTGAVESRDTLTYNIFKDTITSNGKLFAMRLNDYEGFVMLINKPDGLYGIAVDQPGSETLELFLKYPANTGDFFLNGDGDSILVMSTNEKITTKTGTYTCMKYFQKYIYNNPGERNDATTYISPGYGPIGGEEWSQENYGIYYKSSTMSLISIDLK